MTKEDLKRRLDACPVKQFQVWQHYKGDRVVIREVIIDEATLAVYVVYVHDDILFGRTLENFLAKVSQSNLVAEVARFTRVTC